MVFDIDWDNIDWEKVGVSAAQQAINNGADGYMWGSVIGTLEGGFDGYEHYHKFHAPYTDKKFRIDRTPKDNERGHWKGERGESEYVLNEPIRVKRGDKVITIKEVKYENGIPDFSPYAEAEVNIADMTQYRRTKNYRQADTKLANYWNKIRYQKRKWTTDAVTKYRLDNKLTWHEMNNMRSMQLVPTEVNTIFRHSGGVAEYNKMLELEEMIGYD